MLRTGSHTSRYRNWRTRIFQTLVIVMLAINGIAYMQARAMTQYVAAGARTAAPEHLGFLDALSVLALGVQIPRPENRATPSDLGLPYETHIIPYEDGTFLESWFVSQPRSRALVIMFTGFATSKDALLQPAAALHRSGYDILLVDFRGVGGSSGSNTSLGVREAEDVAHTFKYAQARWSQRPIVIYGVSLGAVAALKAVETHLIAPAALILESPFDRLLTTVVNRFHLMSLPAFPGAELLVFWGSVQQGYNGFANNPGDAAAAVRCPALLLHADLDTRVTLVQTTSIYERLAEPKQMVRFSQATHANAWHSDPDFWTEQVIRFLKHEVVQE